MTRFLSAKPLLAAAAGLVALVAATSAQARSDVQFSIGINAPYGYVAPAPVYVQPQPVYVEPQPVYVQPRPVYVQPQPVYYGNGYHRRGAWGDRDGDGVPNAYDRYDNRRGHRSGWGDADRDGVPNRYDREPYNPRWR